MPLRLRKPWHKHHHNNRNHQRTCSNQTPTLLPREAPSSNNPSQIRQIIKIMKVMGRLLIKIKTKIIMKEEMRAETQEQVEKGEPEATHLTDTCDS